MQENFKVNVIENRKKDRGLIMCWGKVDNRNEFISLFDSCYSFISNLDEIECQKIADEITVLAREPMKTSVWKPRALHHVKLLVDGLCKHRCLFEDYLTDFTANETDYARARKILLRMVKSWEIDLSPRGDIR